LIGDAGVTCKDEVSNVDSDDRGVSTHTQAAKFISNEIGHHRLARHPKDPNDKVNILHKVW